MQGTESSRGNVRSDEVHDANIDMEILSHCVVELDTMCSLQMDVIRYATLSSFFSVCMHAISMKLALCCMVAR